MSNLDEGFVCEIFDDQYLHYCCHCGAAQEQGESPATVRADAPANRQSIPCPACSMHGDEVEKGNYCSNCGRFLG